MADLPIVGAPLMLKPGEIVDGVLVLARVLDADGTPSVRSGYTDCDWITRRGLVDIYRTEFDRGQEIT